MRVAPLLIRSTAALAAICALTVSTRCPSQEDAAPRRVATLQPPGRNAFCRIDPNGISVLPSGRLVRPVGAVASITSDPFGLGLSPDGSTVVTIHNRVVTVAPVDDLESARRYPSLDGEEPGPFSRGGYMGVAIAADNRTAFLSGGDAGEVVRFDLQTRRRTGAIPIDGEIDGTTYADSFVGDLAFIPGTSRLLVLDQFNFRMVELDTATDRVTRSIPCGRFPFGLGILPDGSKAYVANVGMFDYPLVPGADPEDPAGTGLKFPAYAVPSPEAEEGVEVEGRRIPGLGPLDAPEAVSVWSIDLARWEVVAKHKTGYRMGEMVEGLEVEGGASPNSIACSDRAVFVSNATNDNISVIDPATERIVDTIRLTVDPRIDRYRGLIPFGLAIDPTGDRLFVALSGLNAVGVIDARKRTVLGYIPTGWFPTKLAVSPDGSELLVATARGFGSGPNGGLRFQAPPEGTYVGDIMLGTIERIAVPDAETLSSWTRRVVANTFEEVEVADDGKNPLPPAPGLRESPIKYIVFITKENRTYDEVFGQVLDGNGDPSLSRYGRRIAREGEFGLPAGRPVTIMPNHLEIARRFAISDNFYCDSDASVHGHRWMVGTYPNEWVETNAATTKTQKLDSSAPGRRYVAGSSGAVYPEDYNEAGGLWEHLARNGVDFYNFGLGFEFAAAAEHAEFADTGVRMLVSFPLPAALYPRTSRTYATYNTSIPDQYRIDEFERELDERFLSGDRPFPRLITMMIPNDHGARPRPEAGYPYRESYMADNDLALGRVLHRLSRTPQWREMLVIITEDDAQDGVDHVDAHRSLLMFASPWVRRGHVSHTHANFGAILKTIYHILDLPPLNQFDATASLLSDVFTDEPDFSPYTAVAVDPAVFDPSQALSPYDREFDPEWLRLAPRIDDEDDFRRSHRERGEEGPAGR
ncbi:bifunctional YncE family protein/alkaline phosphatase family protein [Tautonia sociabilis]|nr:phosphoesterase [Tautonia sociabilis]